MDIGTGIKRRRHELRLSRSRVAELAGISERTLMRIENDGAIERCRETTLVALAHALAWPLARLTRPTEAKDHFMTDRPADGEVLTGEARATFGRTLSSLRKESGYAITPFADACGMSVPDLEATERGERRMQPGEFERARQLLPGDDLHELWLASRTIVYDYTRLGANDRMDIALNDLHDLEVRCQEMFWNCPQAVPGFAQTPAYTDQWLRRTTTMSAPGVAGATEVNTRRVHAFIFRHPATRLLFHFGFQYAIVDKPVMEAQIKHLVTLSTLEGVEIRVLKPHAAPSRSLFGSWGVIDKCLLHAHNLNGAQTNASPHIVSFFVEQFEEVWGCRAASMPIGELLPL